MADDYTDEEDVMLMMEFRDQYYGLWVRFMKEKRRLMAWRKYNKR